MTRVERDGVARAAALMITDGGSRRFGKPQRGINGSTLEEKQGDVEDSLTEQNKTQATVRQSTPFLLLYTLCLFVFHQSVSGPCPKKKVSPVNG